MIGTNGTDAMTEERKPLPKGADFKSLRGNAVEGSAVFPICTSTSANAGPIQLIGTGFFIADHGLFATAKHNLMLKDGPREILFSFQFLPDGYVLRNVWKWVTHPISDIAIGMFRLGQPSENRPINLALALSSSAPGIGDLVATFAFPKTRIEKREDFQELHFDPTWHFGYVEEFYPEGRDRVFYPGPVYSTSMKVIGGASGGPVFGPRGVVIGVNSSGFDVGDGEGPISFVTPIEEAMAMSIPFLNLNTPGGMIVGPSIRDLIKHGRIPID